jgi:hypothetical protein
MEVLHQIEVFISERLARRGMQTRVRNAEMQKCILRAAAFSQLYFWVGMHKGRVLPR